MKKSTLFYLPLFIFAGAYIFIKSVPEKGEEIIDKLTNSSESVEKKLTEPTQRVVQSLDKYGITIDEQKWEDEPPVFRVKATNRGETCMLELQAAIYLKDGTTNTISLYNQGDEFYNGQTTWFEGLVTDELSDISSIQVFSFDRLAY